MKTFMKAEEKGFTLFVAMIVAGTLLLIIAGVTALATRQSLISSSGRESEVAFYAADTGLECALFWDVQNPSGVSAFATSAPSSSIFCNRDASNPGNTWTVGGVTTSTLSTITFLPDPYCATVTVGKAPNGSTTIESLGYNTCNAGSTRRVERAVRAVY